MSQTDKDIILKLENMVLKLKKGSLDSNKKARLSKDLALLAMAVDSELNKAQRLISLINDL